MNRCTTPSFTAPLQFACALMLAAWALPASAQTDAEFKPATRQFPATALRGEIVVVAPPTITLDGKAERLSPGARIYGEQNMLVMSGALVDQKLVVNYLREPGGNIHQVWILNSEEAKLKRPNSKAPWFSFGGSVATEAGAAPATPRTP